MSESCRDSAANDIRQMAVCADDGEPLICTFIRPGYEFHCVPCGRWYEWLQPSKTEWTPELQARLDVLLAEFRTRHE